MRCVSCGYVYWFTLKDGVPTCMYCGRKLLKVKMKGADDE